MLWFVAPAVARITFGKQFHKWEILLVCIFGYMRLQTEHLNSWTTQFLSLSNYEIS